MKLQCVNAPLPLSPITENRYSDTKKGYRKSHYFYVLLDEIQKVDSIQNPYLPDNPNEKIGFVDVLLELEADEVPVVGDSLKKDILPAESLGCDTRWIKSSGWTDEEDAIYRPDIIQSLTDLLQEF